MFAGAFRVREAVAGDFFRALLLGRGWLEESGAAWGRDLLRSFGFGFWLDW